MEPLRQSIKTKKAIIFDLDGTITNMAFDYRKAKRHVISFLIDSEVDPNVLDENNSIYVNLESAVRYISSTFGHDRANLIRDEAFKIVGRYEKEEIPKASLKEGALDLISCLKARRIKAAICTNNSSDTTNSILNKLGVLDLFDIVVTRDDVERLKPYPDSLLLVSKKLRINPDRLIFLGDSSVDLAAAKSAGISFVLLSEDSSKSKSLGNDPNIVTVSSLMEFMRAVGC